MNNVTKFALTAVTSFVSAFILGYGFATGWRFKRPKFPFEKRDEESKKV